MVKGELCRQRPFVDSFCLKSGTSGFSIEVHVRQVGTNYEDKDDLQDTLKEATGMIGGGTLRSKWDDVAAAITLQSHWRRKIDSKEANLRRIASKRLQDWMKQMVVRRHHQRVHHHNEVLIRLRRSAAALCIQRAFQRHRQEAHRSKDKLIQATLLLQSRYRMKKAMVRREAIETLQSWAQVVLIQKHDRDLMNAFRKHRQNAAARRIQQQFEKYCKARDSKIVLTAAVVLVQSKYRRKKAMSLAKVRKEAIFTIQASMKVAVLMKSSRQYRGHKGSKSLVQQHDGEDNGDNVQHRETPTIEMTPEINESERNQAPSMSSRRRRHRFLHKIKRWFTCCLNLKCVNTKHDD